MTTSAIEIAVPIKTVSGLNAREHWRTRAARVKRERRAVFLALVAAGDDIGDDPRGPPATVLLVRHSIRLVDDDNLVGALKAVRDEVAAFFGVDDGPGGLITWRYAQAKNAMPGVVVRMEWVSHDGAAGRGAA